MAFEYNQLAVSGNLTRDAEVRDTKAGGKQVTFTVANNRTVNKEKKTTFFRCIWFGDTAAKIAQYLVKGKPVFVTGAVELDEYEDKDGNKRSSIQIVVNNLQLQYSEGGRTQESTGAQTEEVAANDENFDDVPF